MSREHENHAFRVLVDQAPDLILRFDGALRCVYVNRALARLGLPPDALIGRSVRELPFDADSMAQVEDGLRAALGQGRSGAIECALHFPAGTSASFECFFIPEPASGRNPPGPDTSDPDAFDQNGSDPDAPDQNGSDQNAPDQNGSDRGVSRPAPPGAFAVLRDITEQKFREGRYRYHATLLDAVGEAVMAVNLDGRIVYWNRQAEALHGWASAEVLGWKALDLLVDERDRARVALRLRRVAGGRPWSGELRLRSRDGGSLPALVTVSGVRDEEGELIGVVSTWADLTDRIRLEEQLRQAQKMEAVGRLAGGIAHDFNNLLTTITGNTELALDALPPAAEERAYVQDVLEAADRATRLTRQLLTFSRNQPVQPRVVDVGQVTAGMERLLRRVVGEDLEFVFHRDDKATRVLADPTQMEQLILNLAVNARDAMPLGGTLTVSVENRELKESLDADPFRLPPGRYVAVSVQDTGSGIPPEVQPHIFDPFYTTKPPGKGTGLGLSTVHGIVRQSGGGIVVKSEAGVGATITVYLPGSDRAAVGSPKKAAFRG